MQGHSGHSTNEYSVFGLDSTLEDTTIASFTLFVSLGLKKIMLPRIGRFCDSFMQSDWHIKILL